MAKAGLIGLGIMGRGMARNLALAGHEVVAWNRTAREMPEGFAQPGLRVAESMGEAAAGRKAVVVCVTGPEAQRAIFEGEAGLAARMRGGLVIDATTSSPRQAREFAAAFERQGVAYLEAPVFGSKFQAWNGELDFVCGGAREAYERSAPLFEAMGKSHHYLGASGSGMVMKLMGNLLVAAQAVALAESVAMAKQAGLEKEAVLGVFKSALFASGMVELSARRSCSTIRTSRSST